MIIFRYLVREVLSNMLAVTMILLLIIISARFVRYLAEAAAGKLDAGILLTLMALRLPGYLELILPLGLFIGILMAYGRMHVDQEMTVLAACGIGEKRLLFCTLATSLFVAVIVAMFSLYIGPKGVQASEELLAEQRNRKDFETLKPARFHQLGSDKGVTYTESISDDRKRLSRVFIAEILSQGKDTAPSVLMAKSGETIIDSSNGRKYLLLKEGRRYLGRPGEGNFEVVEFEQYAQRLPEPDYSVRPKKATDGMATQTLWRMGTAEAMAALHWRLSLPVLVMIIGLMAVPLSRTKPRRGRFGKLVPAVLLYIIYVVLANTVRGISENDDQASPVLLWLVHAAFLVYGVLHFLWPSFNTASIGHFFRVSR